MKTEVPFRLGVVQMTSVDDIESNLRQLEVLYQAALSSKADLVVFPENSLFFRLRPGSTVQGFDLNGREAARISAMVDGGGAALMLTTAIPGDHGKFMNSTVLFSSGQGARIVYSKIHMFDVDVPGAPPVRESEVFMADDRPQLIEVAGWKIGLSICYDLRFAELFLHYAQKVDLVLVPSAFLVPTGKAHWHALLKARAIEGQFYVAAPAQAGTHQAADGSTRETFGHALVVGPWGEILCDIDSGQEVRVIELSKAPIAKVRQQIPMAGHRRLKTF